MPHATATVEVLTAEVRVLMVGSRQVTLSVYRQLDRVPAAECEPFGRVSDAQDKLLHDQVAVVGRHAADGSLVRAVRSHPGRQCDAWAEDLGLAEAELAAILIDGRWSRTTTHPTVTYRRDGENIVVHLPTVWNWKYDREANSHQPVWEAVSAAPRETLVAIMEAGLVAVVEYHRKWLAAYEEWKALPLIVLAGLR